MATKKKTMRHASALKAKRQAIQRRIKNFKVRSQVRNLTKQVLQSIGEKKLDVAKEQFKHAQSAWQKAAKNGVFHKNAASRSISRMAARLSSVTK